MKKLIQYEYNRPGKNTMVFDQWLILDRPDAKVLMLEEHRGRGVQIGPDTILDIGAPAIWFVFPGAWHDIGRFHLRDGTFTGWYTNVCTPVALRGDVWSSTDLFLDHWLAPDGTEQWMDEHEFVAALNEKVIDPRTCARVAAERERISAAVTNGDWPPPIARELDLTAARALLQT